MEHHVMCDRDLCHPDCPRRQAATINDYPYPGRK